jgi:3-dehydroquinate dehydratase-1
MKIVAALTDPAQAALAESQGADLVELRFDLMEGNPVDLVQQCRDACSLPVIGTFRSAQEGGQFFGDADAWLEKVRPILPLVDYIDIENQFSCHAHVVKEAGKTIIASHHCGLMMPLHVLFVLERELRAFGDIPKIIVTPRNREDVIELIAFTHAANKPISTGVMGDEFRYARALLPLFGSELAYCSVGNATSAGQYSVEEFRQIVMMLR